MTGHRGRVALVTGSGQGVGAAIAAALAAHGAAVVVNDVSAERARRTAEGIVAAGGHAVPIVADVTDPEAVVGMADQAKLELGAVDILVNNAGVPLSGRVAKPFTQTTPNDWQVLTALNLFSVMACTHAVLKSMMERNWGRVINVVSEAGRVGEKSMAVYAAAKAGAAGFTRSLAKEVGGYGITCNNVSLGSIYSKRDHPDPDKLARLVRRYPVGRLGTPHDVAGAVLWLSADDAEWITGQTIPVNGGYATS
jgi:3-oxoacyl-[acyl-carrier protein] reductase